MLKGNIETKGKNKYRLSCTVNGYRFRQSIDANDKKEAERKLAVWLEKIEKGELKASEYTVSEFADVWLEKQIITLFQISNYRACFKNRIEKI